MKILILGSFLVSIKVLTRPRIRVIMNLSAEHYTKGQITMDNKDKMQGLITMLCERGIINKDQRNHLLGKLSASYENIEFLMDLITGNVPNTDTAVNILFRLS